MSYPSLPCTACPYDASCCAYGTTVDAKEARAIQKHHGKDTVYRTHWGEWRTRVRNGRCVLYQAGKCVVHDKPYYPTTCEGFPWTDGETGAPYEFDLTICGMFEDHPELIELQRAGGRRKAS